MNRISSKNASHSNAFGLLFLVATISSCVANEGPGNLIAGYSCDVFTIERDPDCACCSKSSESCIFEESACAPADSAFVCGARCPEGLSCVTVNGREVCGTASRCDGPSEQACSKCGEQTRECQNGIWSEWSECSEEECEPGSTTECAQGIQECSPTCTWNDCVECLDNQTEAKSCGMCQQRVRSCEESQWGEWSDCQEFGVCEPDKVQLCEGGEQLCDSLCQWTECVAYQCEAPSEATEPCGDCGTRTYSCQDDHTWSEPSECSGERDCTPLTVKDCKGGVRACTSECNWDSCTPQCESKQIETFPCGLCGTASRACDSGRWGEFGACENEAVCAAGSSVACGNGGTRRCNESCQWGACTGQQCDGDPVRICGLCGIQSRVCHNGTWGGWAACTDERQCLPNQVLPCGEGKTHICALDCSWGVCQ